MDVECHTAHHLAQQLWREGGIDHEIVRRAFSADPAASWTRRTIPVDDQPVTFWYLAADRAGVAFTQINGQLVSVFARKIASEDVALVEIKEVGSYLNDPPGPGH